MVSLFMNIGWDSAALGRDVGFESLLHWAEEAARVVAETPDVTLVVRMHPGEVRWGNRDDVRERLRPMPPNVRFVAPEQELDSYALLRMSDIVLTYTSTLGLEAAVQGIRVAVAGDVHYRGRGFTIDVGGPYDLRAAITGPIVPMTPEELELAWRYAFTFFFRVQVPFPAVKAVSTNPVGVARDASELAPGADPYIDFVCDRLLDGKDFTLPDELALRR